MVYWQGKKGTTMNTTKPTLWTRNFTLLTVATVLGAAGGIASSFALSFLVFDATGSTLASALLLAIQLVPQFLVPLVASPWMDRLPRKPFLVGGDAVNGLLYALAGLYLLYQPFDYTMYLLFSLLLAALGAFDSLAFGAFYPLLIPKGCEQKGYTVCGMVYPTMTVIMTPIAAVLYERLGVAVILLVQGALSLLTAFAESRIRVEEPRRTDGAAFSLRLWLADLREALHYLRSDKGIEAIYAYMAVANGVSYGYSPILVAFFRSTPGFTIAMYSLFSVVEFGGRTVGGLVQYHAEIPPKKRFGFAFLVYQIYEWMDVLLLWLPYPLMLASRACCGFLGISSATMRTHAVQTYIPDRLRAKLNAFFNILLYLARCLATLAVGALGEVIDYRLCTSLCGAVALVTCWLTIWRQREAVRQVYNPPASGG